MTFTVNRFRERRSRSGARYWNSTKADCVDDRQRNAAYTCMITSGVGFVLAMHSNGDLLTCKSSQHTFFSSFLVLSSEQLSINCNTYCSGYGDSSRRKNGLARIWLEFKNGKSFESPWQCHVLLNHTGNSLLGPWSYSRRMRQSKVYSIHFTLFHASFTHLDLLAKTKAQWDDSNAANRSESPSSRTVGRILCRTAPAVKHRLG